MPDKQKSSKKTKVKNPAFEETAGCKRMRAAAKKAGKVRAAAKKAGKRNNLRTPEATMGDKLQEVARYAVQGYKPGAIGLVLGITRQTATRLVQQARAEGLIDAFHEKRNGITNEMWRRRVKLSRVSFRLVQKRLETALKKLGSELDHRDVNDAFAALKVTEYTAAIENERPPTSANINIGIFSPEAIKRANDISIKLTKKT